MQIGGRLADLITHIENWPEKKSQLEKLLNHRFHQPEILLQALLHSSFANELNGQLETLPKNNERLEYLGDAVLGLVVAEFLMEKYPDATEGALSRWRSSLVSRKALARIAENLKLGELILLGKGEKHSGGANKRSILAATLEAVIAALYLDGGLEITAAFIRDTFQQLFSLLENHSGDLFELDDKKTKLQEKIQAVYKTVPEYRLVESFGPEHEKTFKVEIVLEGRVIAEGIGPSKKEAEQNAAHKALEALGL